jgi:hypothetical protein
MNQFVQLSEHGKLVFSPEFSIKRRPSPKMSKSTFVRTLGRKVNFVGTQVDKGYPQP